MQAFLTDILTKYPGKRREFLIPILQEVMQTNGYLNVDTVVELAEHFQLPTVKIYSVASYFEQFTFEPDGLHTIEICSGTACHLQHSEAVYEKLFDYLNLHNKNTTDDGLFTLKRVNCLGACSEGVVVRMDDTYYSHADFDRIKNKIDRIRQGQ